MKRSDLKVGDRLYHDTRQDWERTGYVGGTDVTVVAVEPHEKPERWDRRRGVPPRQVERGNGVLVAYANGLREVVQLAHLRGPYDETCAMLERLAVERRAQARREQEQERRAIAAQDAAINDARTLIAVNVTSAGFRDIDAVRVDIAPFRAMVAALHAAGWTYTPEGGDQ